MSRSDELGELERALLGDRGRDHGSEDHPPEQPTPPAARRARWARRACNVVALTCLFVAWELITRGCHGCHVGFIGALGSLRALVLAFVAGGFTVLSMLAGARRSATVLLVASTVTFLVAGVQLQQS
jgi:hypothetical protein